MLTPSRYLELSLATNGGMAPNSKQPLKFSKFLKSKWLTDAQDFEVKKPTIVVNISNSEAIISGSPPHKVLRPRKSTILRGNLRALLLYVIKCPSDRYPLNFWEQLQNTGPYFKVLNRRGSVARYSLQVFKERERHNTYKYKTDIESIYFSMYYKTDIESIYFSMHYSRL